MEVKIKNAAQVLDYVASDLEKLADRLEGKSAGFAPKGHKGEEQGAEEELLRLLGRRPRPSVGNVELDFLMENRAMEERRLDDLVDLVKATRTKTEKGLSCERNYGFNLNDSAYLAAIAITANQLDNNDISDDDDDDDDDSSCEIYARDFFERVDINSELDETEFSDVEDFDVEQSLNSVAQILEKFEMKFLEKN